MRLSIIKAVLTISAMLLPLSGIGYSQEPQPQEQQPSKEPILIDPHVRAAITPLPALKVTLQDIIDVLTDYNVIQEDGGFFCGHFYGLTDFNARSISVCDKYDVTAKRKTVLHEMLHIIYWKHGVYTGPPYEDIIDAAATKLFEQYYGLNTRVSTGGESGIKGDLLPTITIDVDSGPSGDSGPSPIGILQQEQTQPEQPRTEPPAQQSPIDRNPADHNPVDRNPVDRPSTERTIDE